MNKKVKWSVISISTATALTFGGLVVDHQNKNMVSGTTNNNSIQEQPSSFSEDDWDDDAFFSEDEEGYEDDDSDEQYFSDEGRSDEGSSWGQDQYQPAPRRGYEQDHGSSGTSKE